MRPTLTYLAYLVPTLIAVVLLTCYMKPISQWLSSLIQPPVPLPPKVGFIQNLKGTAHARRYQKNKSVPLKKGEAIFNYDHIHVDRQSQLTLQFLSGYTIEFYENSKIILELWDEKEMQAPMYIYLKTGRYKTLKRGASDSVYIFSNNRKLTPEQNLAPLTPSSALPSLQPPQTPPAPPPPALPPPAPLPLPKILLPLPNTPPLTLKQDLQNLSNVYIEKIVSEKRPMFEGCLLRRMAENEAVKGQLLIGFSILPTGHITNVKVVQSQVQNKKLETCIANIFQGIRFRPFEGPIIDFKYPFNFQQ